MTSSSRSALDPISPQRTTSFGRDAKSVFDEGEEEDDFFGDETNDHSNRRFGGGGGGGGGGGFHRGVFNGGGGNVGRGSFRNGVGNGGPALGDLISLEDPNESVNGEGLEPELVQLMDSNEDDDDEDELDDGEPQDVDQDPYSLLAQKERDLILAAELGKALLERNEELQRRNEEILQETGAKIEVVEQEKYVMQQNFALKESEFESVITELRGDNQEMQKQIRSQNENEANMSRQRHSAVGELSEQNQRLTQQLREAAAAEEELQGQIQTLRDQFNVKRSSFNDNQMQMEALKQEVSLLSDRKSDLEKRLRIVTEERDTLSTSLEEANDRIMILERQLTEEEQRVMCQEEELQELRQTNSNLEDRVDRMSIQIASPNPQNQSLFDELDMSSASDNGESGGLHSFSHSKGLKTPSHSPYRLRSPSHQQRSAPTGHSKKPTRQFSSVHVQHADEEYECDDEGDEEGEDELSSSDENSPRRLKSKQKATMESLQKMASEKEAEVRNLQAKVASLESRLAETLAGAPDEDLVNTREELLAQAWKERDEAVEKQHELELQLTQAKMDVMNLDSQLMEAIHKKIELSQQLERWEIDLETLIEMQVKKKMERVTHEEIEEEKMEEEKEIEKGKSLRSRVARKLFKSGQ